VNPTVDGPVLPKTGETAMAIPLANATDALVARLHQQGYRITGRVMHGQAFIVIQRSAA
jgi:hypothetical protein